MSGNVLERENVGGEIVTKKLDNIIKSGKEKIKKWKKILDKIVRIALISAFIYYLQYLVASLVYLIAIILGLGLLY